jgi:hypothetical protein
MRVASVTIANNEFFNDGAGERQDVIIEDQLRRKRTIFHEWRSDLQQVRSPVLELL